MLCEVSTVQMGNNVDVDVANCVPDPDFGGGGGERKYRVAFKSNPGFKK